MCFDYMRSTLGGKTPELDCQLSGYFTYKIINGFLWEYQQTGSVAATARSVGKKLGETGLMGDISPRGLSWFIQLYILLLKCRLYYPAALAAKLRM